MKTVVGGWPGDNINGNVMATMEKEEVCVLDGDRNGGVRLYKGDLVLGRRKSFRCDAM